MKKAQEIEYMVTRIANELRKDGWRQPAPPATAPARPPPRSAPALRAKRPVREMELKEVLRRHNVPNNYRRVRNEYTEQYVDDDDEFSELPPPALRAEDDIEEDDELMEDEDEDEGFIEPKSQRFTPNSNDRVASVYSQIFGRQ